MTSPCIAKEYEKHWEELNDLFSQMLHTALELYGSRKAVCEKIGISYETLVRWEHGEPGRMEIRERLIKHFKENNL